jgi:lipooligosaccharide transport system permease protein
VNSRTKKSLFNDWTSFPRLGVGTMRVWNRDFLYFRRYFLESIIWSFCEPLLYVLAFGYGLGMFVGQIEGVSYMDFFAPAVLAMTAMQASVFETTYSSFTKLRVQKTYETIVMTPVGMDDVVVGEILWGATKSFFSVLGVLVVFLVLGLLRSPLILAALPVLALISFVFSAMSMVVTAYARDYDSFTYFFTLVVTPMSLLSGTFFPLSNFPKWAQGLAALLPLSHGVRVVRALFLGQWNQTYWISIAALVVLALIFTNWSVAQVKRRLIY